MPHQNKGNLTNSSDADDLPGHDLADRLLNALAQSEVAQLIDALFQVLPPQLQEQAIAQLSPNTQQVIKQILALPPTDRPAQTNAPTEQTVSLAKQAQIWSELWQDWDAIVEEAAQEEGKYIVQEEHWEPPYFDATTFNEDLEKLADKMLPMVQIAFEHGFTPDRSFVAALLDAEADILTSIPDWMEITDGIYLERQLTHCALQWEWLTIQQQGQDAFDFTQHMCQYEQEFQEVKFDSDVIPDFLVQLSQSDRRCILAGLNANKETPLWSRVLSDVHSHWYDLYLNLIEQFTPEVYLDNLRETIPQRWQNGLPVINALLTARNYTESLNAISETLRAFLKSNRGEANWMPETSLLLSSSGFYYLSESENILLLLRYYQQTTLELNQTERANALEIQQTAISEWFNWSEMFKVFAEVSLSKSTHQALFTSWRGYIDRQSKPHAWGGYGTVKVDDWWVPWLIDSIADPQKGATWFGEKITQWIANLPGDKTQLGENYDILRLLTKDLVAIQPQRQSFYPQFHQVVIHPQMASQQSDRSRQEYLQQYAPTDLWDRVMNYWKTNLQYFIPKPEFAQKSDYKEHARWMLTLKELSPQDYATLLAQWQVVHQRRSNLWKAMGQMGLV
ncbi:hypothetical protein [Pseudanabaena sp. PCC 6802]|uniref:hypothetical protein n=1 Tax=Pseudanabaena sp. PCC 6802 TaxID=118173 RepID=UPI000345569D|nr:hypothetical protein [Pseudanabaena sp. PCC 6802]